MKVRLEPAAWLALAQAAAGYELERAGRGRAFMKKVRKLSAVLSENPAMGKGVDEDLGLRQIPVRKFPHALVYGVTEGTLVVYTVVDGRRRADYWRRDIDGVEESQGEYNIDGTPEPRLAA